MKLTKFDVLLYIEGGIKSREALTSIINENIKFENASERTINACVRMLKKDKFIIEKNRELRINKSHRKTDDCLAFIHRTKTKDMDYNLLLNKNVVLVFKEISDGGSDMKSLSERTALSKPSLLKIIDVLSKNNFICLEKKKPFHITANLNDITFFYINFCEFSLENFEKRFKIQKFQKIHSKGLTEKMIKLHTYSTTVTEGNTATENDVEKLFGNYPVNLTPREITEILNTRKAVELLYEIRNEEIEMIKIKDIHKILMFNLLNSAGEFCYKRKRIIGSEINPPESGEKIESGINALLNFIKNYESEINPVILACILHFIFVTIHPFADGNGRMARLLHSWIYLRNNLPLFVFDPNRKFEYFETLEMGRKKNIDDFVAFCDKNMHEVLNEIAENSKKQTK